MRISDWSSDVCSSDLTELSGPAHEAEAPYILLAIVAVATAPERNVEDADPLIIADRFDVAACAAREFADLHRYGCGHRKIPLESVAAQDATASPPARKSVVSGTSVSVRVDVGGRRIMKKKKKESRT